MTYGPSEASDLVGAVNYLRTRAEVDGERIGMIGTSMGGNISLYAAPDCQPIKAILAIQPTRLPVFNANFARTELGRFGPLIIKPIDLLYAANARPGRASTTRASRRASSTTRWSSTSRAPATSGARWRSSRSSRGSRRRSTAR